MKTMEFSTGGAVGLSLATALALSAVTLCSVAGAQTSSPTVAVPSAEPGEIPGWKWTPPADRPFPILAYGSPLAVVTNKVKPKPTEVDADLSLLTDETGRRMAEAGFNLCVLLNTRKPEAVRKALAFCEKAGIGLVLYDSRLYLLKKDPDAVKAAVAEWSKARALAAYHVIDEPGNKADYSGLGAIRETLAQLDSGHWAYANLLPTYGMQIDLYPDYLSRFINAFKPVVLSFDHYCITRQGVRPDYYQNQGSTGHRRPGTEAQNAFAPSRDPHRSSRFPLDTPLLQKPLAGSGLRG